MGPPPTFAIFACLLLVISALAATLCIPSVRAEERKIRSDKTMTERERALALSKFRRETRRAVGKEGRFRLPPRGFSIEKAIDLCQASAMPRITRAFPVQAERADTLKEFVAEMSQRRTEVDEFYARFGVIEETWHAQPLPDGGQLIIVVTDVEDVAAFAKFAESEAEFDTWFKNRVAEVSGIELDTAPEGPPAQTLFGWRAAAE